MIIPGKVGIYLTGSWPSITGNPLNLGRKVRNKGFYMGISRKGRYDTTSSKRQKAGVNEAKTLNSLAGPSKSQENCIFLVGCGP